MTSNKTPILGIIALVGAVIAIGIAGFAFMHVSSVRAAGGTTNYDTGAFSGLQVGMNCNNGFGVCLGTLMSSNNFATTTLIGSGSASYYQITASSTKQFDLTCPNVTAADSVDAFWAPTTTVAVTGEGWRIVDAQASTTPGVCTVLVSNDSGATATIPQGLASTTGYRAQH